MIAAIGGIWRRYRSVATAAETEPGLADGTQSNEIADAQTEKPSPFVGLDKHGDGDLLSFVGLDKRGDGDLLSNAQDLGSAPATNEPKIAAFVRLDKRSEPIEQLSFARLD